MASVVASVAGKAGDRLHDMVSSSSYGLLAGLGAVVAAAGALTARYASGVVRDSRARAAVDDKRKRKQERSRRTIAHLAEKLQKEPISEHEVNEIINLDLQSLVEKLKEGTLSPVQVLKAFQKKALQIHDRTNCLIEVITEAETWAKELERGPREGLLYGVPISIKDDVAIQGYDSTIGCAAFIDKPAKEDAAILKVLKKHGAIPFVRTNVPQLCLSFEPGNPIYGKVLHPANPLLIPGGSSSGEAALIGAGGSVLGIGSDLAGSVRVPAHFTGICSFKPTSQRMSNVGCLEGYTDYEQNELQAVFGPMSASVDNIVLSLRALWDGQSLTQLDPMSLPLAFNEKVYNSDRRLRIGYYLDDGNFQLFPGCERAVLSAKAMLEDMGHEVVPWRIPDMTRACDLELALYQADGGAHLQDLLKYDIIDPTIEPLLASDDASPWWAKLVPKKLAEFLCSSQKSDVSSFFLRASELREYAVSVARSWQEAGLDAVICPPFPMPAPPFGNTDLCIETGLVYPIAYNALNMPAGVVSFTEANQQDIDALKDFPLHDQKHRRAKEVMGSSLGLPIGVMVVGARYQDELCLSVMRQIQEGARRSRAYVNNAVPLY